MTDIAVLGLGNFGTALACNWSAHGKAVHGWTVEQDGRLQDWGKRLLEIQESLQTIHERMLGSDVGQSPSAGASADDSAAEAAGG